MLTNLFFPRVAGVRVERLWREGATIHLKVVGTRRWARCPLCQRRSKRPHSRYERTLADVSCAGNRVVVYLCVCRFVCRVRWCRRKICAERLPDLVAPFARRTTRLAAHLLRAAFDLGGELGVRHLAAEGISVSPRTLLRLVRAVPLPAEEPVRVLGVDDWSRRKGHDVGTILVNLETHTVIDLLPDRTAETLALWLRRPPEREVVTRDRAGADAEGIRRGAPQAVQVADRFHLRKNASDARERYLTRQHAALRQAVLVGAPIGDGPVAEGAAEGAMAVAMTLGEIVPVVDATGVPAANEQPERRARRLARDEEVIALRATGARCRVIAARVGLGQRTVQRWLQAGHVPTRQRRSERPGQAAPFAVYLRERWAQGCHNATQLYRALRGRG